MKDTRVIHLVVQNCSNCPYYRLKQQHQEPFDWYMGCYWPVNQKLFEDRSFDTHKELHPSCPLPIK